MRGVALNQGRVLHVEDLHFGRHYICYIRKPACQTCAQHSASSDTPFWSIESMIHVSDTQTQSRSQQAQSALSWHPYTSSMQDLCTTPAPDNIAYTALLEFLAAEAWEDRLKHCEHYHPHHLPLPGQMMSPHQTFTQRAYEQQQYDTQTAETVKASHTV